MNQQSMSCSFCLGNNHTVQFCRNPQIEESFKYLICISINCTDYENAKTALNDFNDTLVSAIGVKMTRSLPEESREHHTTKIIEAVKIEIEYLSHLSGIQRDEYMDWLCKEELMSTPEPPDHWTDFSSDYSESEPQDHWTDFSSVYSESNSINAYYTGVNLETVFDSLPEEPPAHPIYTLSDRLVGSDSSDTTENQQKCSPTPLLLCLETHEELTATTECAICYETKTALEMDTFQCQHPFCHCCVLHLLVTTASMRCPFCRVQVKTIEVKDTEKFNDIEDPPLYLYME